MEEASKKKIKYIIPLAGIFIVVTMLFCMLFVSVSMSMSVWQQATLDASEVTKQRAKVLSAVMSKKVGEVKDFLVFSNTAFSAFTDEFEAFSAVTDFGNGLECNALYYIRTDGRIYCCTESGSERYNAVPANIVKLTESEEMSISNPYKGSSGSEEVAIYYPLESEKLPAFASVAESNQGVRAVIGTYLTNELYDQCDFVKSGGSSTYFADAKGNIHYSSADYTGEKSIRNVLAGFITDEQDITYFLKEMAEKSEKSDVYEENDEKFIVAGSGVALLPDLYAVTVVSGEAVDARTNSLVRTASIVGGFIVLCFLIVLFYFRFVDVRNMRRIRTAESIDQVAQCSNQIKFEMDAQRLVDKNVEFKYAIIYFNIEGYKYINQIYGYQVGNDMIYFMSTVISKLIHPGDTYGRSTDGRFILLTHYNTRNDLVERFETVNEMLSEFEPIQLNRYRVKLKAGIYCVDRTKNHTVAEMLDRAVFSYQNIKENNHVLYDYYDSDSRNTLLKTAEIEASMESALRNREFEMYLQPKYNIQQNRMDGAEALVRWNRPGAGLLQPGTFISIFEKNGFIAELDKFIYEEACRFISDQTAKGERVVPISINVSRASADNVNFLDEYIAIKEKYGIADGFLELEFTESLAMESYEFLSKTVAVLRENGFSCSMDDFGEGYSSFKALKALPFNIIKLDKFFLIQSGNPQRDEYLLSGVIAMAKKLEMKIIMEGVETEDELQLLRKMKCDSIQGYFYSRPIPVPDFIYFSKQAFEKKGKSAVIN